MSENLHINVCGRTELAGNHVDHQGGKVVCASVNRSIEMTLVPNDSYAVNLSSEHFDDISVDLRNLSPDPKEKGTSSALIKGMAAGAQKHGWALKGFDAKMSSDIPIGGGLSSSAAFEVAFGVAFSILANAQDVRQSALLLDIAAMGQKAENDYFGKPCGLMDEAACALGGIVALDFADIDLPQVEYIADSLPWSDLSLCMVDCGADHACAIGDYASIPLDMRAIAEYLGKHVLSEVKPDEFWDALPQIRRRCGDRAALRAMHYFDEMCFVEKRIEALKAKDKEKFLEYTRLSSQSSAQQLQNVSSTGSGSQPAMVALTLCQRILGNSGAARIHGGGFGGSIQAFVPNDLVKHFTAKMNQYLGFEAVSILEITPQGVKAQWC